MSGEHTVFDSRRHNRDDIDEAKIAEVQNEMDKPRFAESARDKGNEPPEPLSRKPPAHSA